MHMHTGASVVKRHEQCESCLCWQRNVSQPAEHACMEVVLAVNRLAMALDIRRVVDIGYLLYIVRV